MTAPSALVLHSHQRLFLEALHRLLERDHDFHPVRSCAEVDEAVRVALQQQACVVMLDADDGESRVLLAVEDLRRRLPAARTVLLASAATDRLVDQAVRMQCAGVMLKQESVSTVVRALTDISMGRAFWSEAARQRLVRTRRPGDGHPAETSRIELLSLRERQVLELLAEGHSKKQIAAMIHLSVKTIENHTTNLMGKLQIHDRVQLARYAIREGLISA